MVKQLELQAGFHIGLSIFHNHSDFQIHTVKTYLGRYLFSGDIRSIEFPRKNIRRIKYTQNRNFAAENVHSEEYSQQRKVVGKNNHDTEYSFSRMITA